MLDIDKSFATFVNKVSWNSCSSALFQELVRSGIKPAEDLWGKEIYRSSSQNCKRLSRPLVGRQNLLWNENLATISREEAKRLKREMNWRDFEPKSPSNTLNQEIDILIEKLKIWEEHTLIMGWEVLETPFQILYNNLLHGPYYALKKKKVFDYSVRVTISTTNVLVPEDITPFKLKGLDQLFPSRHLINFMIPKDLSDVTDYSFTKRACKIPEMLFSYFKKFLKTGHDVYFREFDELDAIKLCNSRKGITTSGKKDESYRIRINRGLPMDLALSSWNYEISWTSKSADEGRVIAIADIPTKNINHIIRENLKGVLNNPWDCYGKMRTSFLKHLDKRPGRFFIMIDQKKSGWTFPQELIALCFKALYEEYSWEHFKTAYEIFSNGNINYSIEGINRKPLRGFVLGMWDNLMSYILSCLFSLFIDEELNDLPINPEKDLKGMFWGDDQVIRTENIPKSIVITIWNRWLIYLTRVGLEINKGKSFLSEVGIFCEAYGSDPDILLEKGIIYPLTFFNSLVGVNTYHRKMLWSASEDITSKSVAWFDTRHREIVKDLARKCGFITRDTIGWEFNSYEWSLPIQLGGWRVFRDEDGKNHLFRFLHENKIPDEYIRVGLLGLQNNEKRVRNNIFDQINKSPWWDNLMSTIGSFNRSSRDYITNKLLALSYEKMIKRNDNYRFLHIFAKERRQAFSSNKTVDLTQLIYKLYHDGSFKGDTVELDLLVKRPMTYEFEEFEQEPFKGFRIDPLRATMIIANRVGYFNSSVKLSKDYSFKRLIASIESVVSSSKVMLPYDWVTWALQCDIDLWSLYRNSKEIGINIFEYYPPVISYNKEKVHIDPLDEYQYVYWDNEYGCSFVLKKTQADLLCREKHGIKPTLIKSSLLNIFEDEYILKCEVRSHEIKPEKNEDEDSLIMESELASQLFEKATYVPPPPQTTVDLSQMTQAYSAVVDLSTLDNDLMWEEEDDESSSSNNNSDDVINILQQYDIEDIDLLEFDALDDYG